jgi:crossover junction endodeoxyribonuclease RuvC
VLILGCDTAMRCTGYGIVSMQGKLWRAVDCGVIRNPAKIPHSECLRRLSGGIAELVSRYKPEIAVIEGGFFQRNVRTAMVLGMARGAAVAQLASLGIPVYEYAPRRARQVVVGMGGATKEEVAALLARQLQLQIESIPLDATDGPGFVPRYSGRPPGSFE